MIKIAVDAMGGDHAPLEIIMGAIQAIKAFPIHVVLVGKEPVIQSHLDLLYKNTIPEQLSIVHASEEVAMSESPSQSFKKKKESSIRVGIDLLKEKKVDGFVSAGNTGAVMTAATLVLGRIPGIERPALSIGIPTPSGPVLMLDLGSNVDCKPEHLFQFAMMGSSFSELVLNISKPRVGLLNIGEEKDKGNQLTQAVYPLLEDSHLNFIGNVETREVFSGKADVIVCDGFVGNAVLKFGEGLVDYILAFFKRRCKSSVSAMLGSFFLMPTLKALKKQMDYEEIGGAPLLGVNGVTIVSHGKSKAKAIKNAIRNAYEAVHHDMLAVIIKEEK